MAHQMGVLRHLEGGTAHQADFTRWRDLKVLHAPRSHSYMPKVLLNLQRDLRVLTGEGPLPELGAVRAVLEGIDRCVCGTPGGLCGDSPPAEIRHLVSLRPHRGATIVTTQLIYERMDDDPCPWSWFGELKRVRQTMTHAMATTLDAVTLAYTHAGR